MPSFRRARTDYPAGVVAIYDNGGQSADRYTVVYPPIITDGIAWWQYVTMSPDPFWPQGVCMHGEGQQRPTSGWGTSRRDKVIAFEDLPADCQRVVREDLEGEA